MNRLIFLAIGTCFLISACARSPVFREEGYALFRSNYPVVRVNGVEVEPSYTLDIPSGENTLVIVYHTYRFDYHCTFTWKAAANTVYEVTDQYNKYPLTLYRWAGTNGLWASRLDPIDPLECIPKQR